MTKIKPTSDGGSIIVGSIDEHFCVIKLNISSDIDWIRTFNSPATSYDLVLDVAEDISAVTPSFFVLAEYWAVIPIAQSFALLKISHSGHTVWSKRYFDGANDVGMTGALAWNIFTGRLNMVFVSDMLGNDDQGIIVFEVNEEDGVVEKMIKVGEIGKSYNVYDMIINDNGDIIVVGDVDDVAFRDALIIKINKDISSVLWKLQIGNDDSTDTAKSIVMKNEGELGFVVVGKSNINGRNNGFILSIDSAGSVEEFYLIEHIETTSIVNSNELSSYYISGFNSSTGAFIGLIDLANGASMLQYGSNIDPQDLTSDSNFVSFILKDNGAIGKSIVAVGSVMEGENSRNLMEKIEEVKGSGFYYCNGGEVSSDFISSSFLPNVISETIITYDNTISGISIMDVDYDVNNITTTPIVTTSCSCELLHWLYDKKNEFDIVLNEINEFKVNVSAENECGGAFTYNITSTKGDESLFSLAIENDSLNQILIQINMEKAKSILNSQHVYWNENVTLFVMDQIRELRRTFLFNVKTETNYINIPWVIYIIIPIIFICIIILIIIIFISIVIFIFIILKRKSHKRFPDKQIHSQVQLQLSNDSNDLNDFIQEIPKEWIIKYKDIKVEKKLASGGGGFVYKAKWSHNEIVFKLCRLSSEHDIIHFSREVKLMLTQKHPNIISAFGVVVDQSRTGIVMQYAPLGSLGNYIHNRNERNINWNEKFIIAMDVLSGLSFLHKNEVLHRDLKSANILMFKDGDVSHAKITDFGLSKHQSNPQQSATCRVIGTYEYMPPDLFDEGKIIYTQKCDMYSVGVIFHELITFEKPFNKIINKAIIPMRVKMGKLSLKIPEVNKCPQVFINVLQSLLSIDPNQRMMCEEVIEVLEKGKKQICEFQEKI